MKTGTRGPERQRKMPVMTTWRIREDLAGEQSVCKRIIPWKGPLRVDLLLSGWMVKRRPVQLVMDTCPARSLNRLCGCNMVIHHTEEHNNNQPYWFIKKPYWRADKAKDFTCIAQRPKGFPHLQDPWRLVYRGCCWRCAQKAMPWISSYVQPSPVLQEGCPF